jgi:hypothetical protein
VVALMKTASYFGISDIPSLNMKLKECPLSSEAHLKLSRARASLASVKLYFSTKQAILAN